VTLLTKRLLIALGLPCLLMVCGYAFRHLLTQQHDLLTLLPHLPYLLAIIGMLLSLGYNNARDFHLLLIITIAYAGLQQLYWTHLQQWDSSLLITAIYFLVPINLILQNLLADRGIFSSHGLWRMVIATLQVSLMFWLLHEQGYSLQHFFDYTPPDWPLHRFTSITFLGVVTFVSGLILFGLQSLLHHSVLHAGRWAMLLSLLLAMHHVQTPLLSSLFFSIAAFACLLAIILNSYNLAYLDELTHLPTRRALKQRMLSLGRRYTLAVVDIDFFKKINDNYGHDVGDQVLRMVAGHLRKVHGGGKAYRYGGEEFVIVFQGKDAGEAMLMLETLRERIANQPFVQRSRLRPRNRPKKPRQRIRVNHINVSVSIGVAEKATHHDTADDVLKSADKKLYQAKKSGRNRVCA
jgi:diguanylate cyclase (GGDEF)-like protein